MLKKSYSDLRFRVPPLGASDSSLYQLSIKHLKKCSEKIDFPKHWVKLETYRNLQHEGEYYVYTV